MLKYSLKTLIAILLISLIAACSSTGSKDGAPKKRLNPNKIKDAKPRYEPIKRAGNKNPYTVFGKTYHLLPNNKNYKEHGVASWYGTKFHGRPTANGEKYDLYKMTAAHTRLRIPSYVRVTNKGNGRSAIVRVNDRGPFHGNRIIDLSYAAAVKLGFAEKGTANVIVESIEVGRFNKYNRKKDIKPYQPVVQAPPVINSNKQWYLQLAALSRYDQADKMTRRVKTALAFPVKLVSKDNLHRVWVGPYQQKQSAEEARYKLMERGFGEGIVIFR